MLFFIWLHWKESGQTTCYCAQADTSADALALAIGNRGRAIDSGEAIPWPENGPKPPTLNASYQGSFRLKSFQYCRDLLIAAGVSPDAPKRTTPGKRGGTLEDVRPWTKE